MGVIKYKGGVSGKDYEIVEETAGEAKIKNASDGIDLLKADSTTITDAGGVKLAFHGSRHQRGAEDAIDDPNISNIADSGDVACTVGTGGTATRTTVYTPPPSYNNVIPFAVKMAIGGTVGSGETVSINVKAVLDDSSEFVIASYSIAGTTGSATTYNTFESLLANVISAGVNINVKRITSIVADVVSSATTTSATATVRVMGVIT